MENGADFVSALIQRVTCFTEVANPRLQVNMCYLHLYKNDSPVDDALLCPNFQLIVKTVIVIKTSVIFIYSV